MQVSYSSFIINETITSQSLCVISNDSLYIHFSVYKDLILVSCSTFLDRYHILLPLLNCLYDFENLRCLYPCNLITQIQAIITQNNQLLINQWINYMGL